ncbi:MAG: MoxR family ATPase [Planctomycetaceae bacterium]|nr:MoxR family ATPase [Planctomycetaceae bacterium]
MNTAVATPSAPTDRHADAIDRLRRLLNTSLCGKSTVVDQVLICLFSHGHLLLEDKPGLGKTTLAKAIAKGIGGRFARVQCTPDLLPSDITGFNLFNQKTQDFDFRPGPVFSEVMLADEINRATPRTQSALLEAMAERQVTVDAIQHRLADEFFVIATQNPTEQHGTYPLPEAQLDRFAMKLSIGYPDPSAEMELLKAARESEGEASESDGPIFDEGQLRQIQNEVASLYVDEKLQDYLVRLAAETRSHPHIVLGLSPRGMLTWQRAAQSRAFLNHRSFVTPDDIQDVAEPVLSVRLGIDHEDPLPTIREILETISVPEYTVPE